MIAQSSEKVDHNANQQLIQYSTFRLKGKLYGIEVIKVQEIVKPMILTKVPLAPSYVMGLINLRGQIATAIGLLELFELGQSNEERMMNIICNVNGYLVSLLIDEIDDVFEVSYNDFSSLPATVPAQLKKFLSGVYRLDDKLLSVIDMDKIASYLKLTKI